MLKKSFSKSLTFALEYIFFNERKIYVEHFVNLFPCYKRLVTLNQDAYPTSISSCFVSAPSQSFAFLLHHSFPCRIVFLSPFHSIYYFQIPSSFHIFVIFSSSQTTSVHHLYYITLIFP